MKSKEYLENVRKAPTLCRAVLTKITVEGERATFHLVTDCTYTDDDVRYAREVSSKFVPNGFTADVRLLKSVPSQEGVKKAILTILQQRFPLVAAFVVAEDVFVEIDGQGGRFCVEAEEGEKTQFYSSHVLDELSKELARTFCGTWLGTLRFKKKERGEIVREDVPVEYVLVPRSFEIENGEAIDGAHPKRATYIADLNKEEQGIAVCGTIRFIAEKESKSGKPYFTLTLDDGSGFMRISYFTRKATLEKVRALKAGDSVCIAGDNELFNGALSFRARSIDFGAPPKDFVPETRPSRPAPAKYRKVFPEPINDVVQANFFDQSVLPDALIKGEFVVFDLETTGLNNTPTAGMMDRIIEVGAVRIRDGVICEKFSSFVACPVRLSEEIKGLTGIDDEMLVGAPAIEEVIADFFKFSNGCILVGHNVQFDYKFIRYYGEKEGYLFEQKQLDTLALAQETLRLSNYKLNTVADHFGFTFNHHRAFDDAFVTAKIFIELAKLKKSLPI